MYSHWSYTPLCNYWAGAMCAIVVTCTPSKRTCTNRRDRKNQRRRQSFFFVKCAPYYRCRRLVHLLAILWRKFCVFCQQKMSSLARVSHISWRVKIQEILTLWYLSLGERTKAVAARVVTDRQTHTHTHTHTHKLSTVILLCMCRGLIMS